MDFAVLGGIKLSEVVVAMDEAIPEVEAVMAAVKNLYFSGGLALARTTLFKDRRGEVPGVVPVHRGHF